VKIICSCSHLLGLYHTVRNSITWSIVSKTCGFFRSPIREKMKICASTSVVRVDRRIEYKIIRKIHWK